MLRLLDSRRPTSLPSSYPPPPTHPHPHPHTFQARIPPPPPIRNSHQEPALEQSCSACGGQRPCARRGGRGGGGGRVGGRGDMAVVRPVPPRWRVTRPLVMRPPVMRPPVMRPPMRARTQTALAVCVAAGAAGAAAAGARRGAAEAHAVPHLPPACRPLPPRRRRASSGRRAAGLGCGSDVCIGGGGRCWWWRRPRVGPGPGQTTGRGYELSRAGRLDTDRRVTTWLQHPAKFTGTLQSRPGE